MFKLAMAGSIGLVLAGTGYVMGQKNEKEAIAKYELAGPQVEFMTQCKAALSSEKKKFKMRSANEGCGCIARQVGTGLAATDYRYLVELHRAVLAEHGKNDAKRFERRIDAAASSAGIPSRRMVDLLTRFKRAQDTCFKGTPV